MDDVALVYSKFKKRHERGLFIMNENITCHFGWFEKTLICLRLAGIRLDMMDLLLQE